MHEALPMYVYEVQYSPDGFGDRARPAFRAFTKTAANAYLRSRLNNEGVGVLPGVSLRFYFDFDDKRLHWKVLRPCEGGHKTEYYGFFQIVRIPIGIGGRTLLDGPDEKICTLPRSIAPPINTAPPTE